jgi:PEP-utilizing family enzyme
VVEGARTAVRDLSICGEMAGDPLHTALLIGLGLREFSVAPGQMLEVKDAIRRTRFEDAARLARAALELGSAAELEVLLNLERPLPAAVGKRASTLRTRSGPDLNVAVLDGCEHARNPRVAMCRCDACRSRSGRAGQIGWIVRPLPVVPHRQEPLREPGREHHVRQSIGDAAHAGGAAIWLDGRAGHLRVDFLRDARREIDEFLEFAAHSPIGVHDGIDRVPEVGGIAERADPRESDVPGDGGVGAHRGVGGGGSE